MGSYAEIKARMDAEWAKLEEDDLAAKNKGTLIGRYISEPFADGNAIYKITKENKKTVIVEVVEIGDAWVLPYWGAKASIKKDYALQKIHQRETMRALFSKRSTI